MKLNFYETFVWWRKFAPPYIVSQEFKDYLSTLEHCKKEVNGNIIPSGMYEVPTSQLSKEFKAWIKIKREKDSKLDGKIK